MKKVVFLNGPKGSGKDTLGEALAKHLGGYTARFKEVLYKHTADIFNVDQSWLEEIANDTTLKELPCEELHGYSPRAALIFTSENVYKPVYGKDYFGKKTLELLEEGITFITDSGFREEAETIVDGIGAENCVLISLCRKGHYFDETDSRNYINLDDLNVSRFGYNNAWSVEEGVESIIEMLTLFNFITEEDTYE